MVIILARVTYYYKFQLDDKIKSNFDNCSEEDYVKNDEQRQSINKNIGKSNWRATRKKMDFGLPVIFSIIWLAIVIARNCLV